QDLDRRVVKMESAAARIPELDFEVPAFTQRGVLTTVEGIIERAVTALEQDQPARRAADEEVATKIEEFIGKLKRLKELHSPFTLVSGRRSAGLSWARATSEHPRAPQIIDDPSGNSFVENPHAPQKDEALVVTHYRRTAQQDALLGITRHGDTPLPGTQVLQFNTNCPECNAPASTNMKLVQIPHFKEVIIMATNCDSCGHRTNEVKSGGGIEAQGTRITLRITDPSDMTRDVLKVSGARAARAQRAAGAAARGQRVPLQSETCSVEIPELEFELGMGALGGKFTTLEGLLKDIKELVERNPFSLGDSAAPDRTAVLRDFGRRLLDVSAGGRA
ncbi:ZPR1 protein, partial [Crypturellus undulatus]|nr:ZPR1 protein [Crypturellus undulatus]